MFLEMEQVNNFDKIKPLLVFEEGVTYYFIQVIQRKKENPDLPKSEIQRGFWYITSIERSVLWQVRNLQKHILVWVGLLV